MKRILLTMLFVASIALIGYSATSPSADTKSTFYNGYAWGGHENKDDARDWAQAIEDNVDTSQAQTAGTSSTNTLVDVTVDADGKTLTIAETGSVQTNTGATGATAFTLPEASTAIGVEYTFIVGVAQELRITPASGDKINHAGTLAADAEYYTANAIGEVCQLICLDAVQWVVISETGTWAEATP